MNIHINKDEFEYLNSLPSNYKFTIGSELYNLNDEGSDKDYLIITLPFFNKTYSAFGNHHQFQYIDVDNNIDYNFVDIITFIKNLVSGDSTINYELLYSKEFKNSIYGWLSNIYLEEFTSYNIMRSYAGLADRDLRHLNRRTGRDITSGILHIERGILFFKNLLNKTKFDLILPEQFKVWRSTNDWQKNYILNIPYKKQEIKILRETLNKHLELGAVPRFLKPNIQKEINERLLNMFQYMNVKDINLPLSLLEKIYYSNENIEMKYN